MATLRRLCKVGLRIALAVSCSVCFASEQSEPASTELTDDGIILVTPAGMALYTYGPDDSTPGKSQCVSEPHPAFHDPTGGFGMIPLPRADVHKSCAQKWPPFQADEHAKSAGDWSVIERPEGIRQWAYRGHPLYTSIKDHKAGDRNGAVAIGQVNLGGRGWNLAMAPSNLPPGLKLVRREEGLVFATSNGRPVYTPSGVTAQNACAGCNELFQPIAAPAVASVSGDWSIVGAGAGRRQYAYKRKALYAAPVNLSDSEIAEAGGWRTAVFRKAPGTPPQIDTQLSLLGEVYTDKDKRTLYAFTCGTPAGDGVRCDDPGDAAEYWVMLCGDASECARRWRPYLAPADARAVGDWSVAEVAYPMFTEATGFTYPPEVPRVKAWAYRGMPVYTYYEDQSPGDIWGDGIRLFAFSGFYALQVPGRGLLD